MKVVLLYIYHLKTSPPLSLGLGTYKTHLNLYNLNVTMLRFFTVYGPRGRPDMAAYRFGLEYNRPYAFVMDKSRPVLFSTRA